MTAHNELRRNRAEEGGVMTDEPVTVTPVDYEQYRPALQAWYDACAKRGTIADPMDAHDRKYIRAGLAFAAAIRALATKDVK